MSSFTYGWPSFVLIVCLKKMKQWVLARVSFMHCPWRQIPFRRWLLLPRKTAQRSVESFQKEQCSISESASKGSHFSPLMCVWFSCCILNWPVMCFYFQPLKYASSASLYQQQDGSPALSASTQTGVNSKVSAWLQQTHDIDATSNGAFTDCTQVTECVNVLRDVKEEICLSSVSKYLCPVLCVRTGSLSARTDRTGSAHPASPLAGRGTANHKYRFRDAD